MIKFKISFVFAVLLLLSTAYVSAQQNTQYTQFMYSKLWMNPAYAGSHDIGCVQAISRNQWLGIDEAPKSQSINFMTPTFGNNVGLGFSLNHDQLGPTDSWFLNLSYAYRIKTEKGRFSMGVQANITTYSIDYQKLRTLEQGDGILPDQRGQITLPNIGFGLYYNTDKYFVGLSMPLIVQGDLSFETGDGSYLSRQETHAYLMAGLVHKIGERVQGKPAFLLKKVTNAPIDFDVNYTLIFMNKLWAGASYRFGGDQFGGFGESIAATVQYQVSRSLRLGLAYDFTLSQLKAVNNGTIEFMAQMCISQHSDALTNPRFF